MHIATSPILKSFKMDRIDHKDKNAIDRRISIFIHYPVLYSKTQILYNYYTYMYSDYIYYSPAV